MNTPLLSDTQYPHRWNDYIGQTRAKESLRVAAKSAKLRKQPLDHVLVANPQAGVGKTALAVLTASEVKREAFVVSGSMDEDTARFRFADMKDRDILIYEEFHRLFEGTKRSWGWILNYMQDQLLMGPLGMEKQPRVTIIATTTEAGAIPEAVASRFTLRPLIEPYTVEEAARIALRQSQDILAGLPPLHRKDAEALAIGASHNPRAMRQLLCILRDLTITNTLPLGRNHYNIPALLEWEGITPDGLDRISQRYLTILATEFGGRAGERAIADRLQYAGGLASIERLLMDRGLVGKTNSGRSLTQAGIARAKALLDGSAA